MYSETAKLCDALTAAMKAGSVMLFDSALWHGGGANNSDERRFAFSCGVLSGVGRVLLPLVEGPLGPHVDQCLLLRSSSAVGTYTVHARCGQHERD